MSSDVRSSESSSRVNTWGEVTTAGTQGIPSPTAHIQTPAGPSSFPLAAIVVLVVFGGLVLIVLAYKLYVYIYTRMQYTREDEESQIPGPTKPPPMSAAWGSATIKSNSSLLQGSSSFVSTSRRNSEFGDNLSPTDPRTESPNRSQTSTPSSTPTNSGFIRSPLPTPSLHSLNTPGRRSRLGSKITGAPHAPHSRIDIVPPLPLAPPPGVIIATTASTLDFSPIAGMGQDWYNAYDHRDKSFDGLRPVNQGFVKDALTSASLDSDMRQMREQYKQQGLRPKGSLQDTNSGESHL